MMNRPFQSVMMYPARLAVFALATTLPSLSLLSAEAEAKAKADATPAAAAKPTPKPKPAAEPKPPQPKLDFSVFPEKVSLSSARDFQSLVATVRRPDSITIDVTDQVKWNIQSGEKPIAKVEGNVVRPLADGDGKIVVNYAGQNVEIPLHVEKSTVDPPISFSADVMPVLTRAGCNTGSCHGAARGKDGFRLSLFGFDPKGDYDRITREIGVRRINLAVPAESLLLKKAIGSVPHSGGKLFEADSDLYKTMHRWLVEGAVMDSPKAMPPETTSLTFSPPQSVIEGSENQQRFVAVAQFADGSTRDVTKLAAFTTNDSGVASIDPDAVVTAGRRGEAFVTARFGTHTVGSQVLVLPKDLKYAAPKIEGNYIDQLVGKKLQQLRILPSEICSDEEFLRRVTIDIVGLLPTEDEYRKFVMDPGADKRARKIDELLGRKEFSEIWAMKFAQLLMIKSTNQVSYKSAYLYATWLTDQFAREVPIDQMVRELLTGSGGTFSTPQTNFYEIERDTLKTSENVAQVFMGIRTQCAQCHNHPFDRWTMDDYYGFASFFTQIGRKAAEDYRERIVYNRGGGEFNHPVTKKPVPPTFLGAGAADTKGKDRRQVVAEWLTAKENPFFAPSIANRVWAHFMGVGNVSPVDDIRVSNPPSNPELFDELGRKFVEYNFNFKQLVRDICNSKAYQRSVETNETNAHDNRNYAHAVVRRIPAESLLDCLSQVTGAPDKFRGLPVGARATQIADGRTSTYFLTTFGRSPRATVCECEATTEPTLSQALHLLNGDAVHNKIVRGKQISKWLSENVLPSEIIDRIFISCLSRLPNGTERDSLLEGFDKLADAKAQQQHLEDVYWAILNSREFVFNH